MKLRGQDAATTAWRSEGGSAITYRVGRDLRVLAAGVSALGLAGAVASALMVDHAATRNLLAGMALTALAAPFGFMFVHSLRFRVTIDARGIERAGWGQPRRLAWEQIRGLRQRSHKGHVTVVVVPKDEGMGRIELSGPMLDAQFWGRMRKIPDVDAEDLARAEAELLASPALGATMAQRTAALARARVVARLLNWTSVAAGGCAFAFPADPIAVVAAFLFPLLALAAALFGGGVFQLLEAPNDPRPRLWMALFVPAYCASLRALQLQLVLPAQLLRPALVVGAVLTALAAVGDRALRARPLQLLLVLPLMVGMSASGLAFSDCLRDDSPVTEHVTYLANKGRTPRGGRAVTLGPFGPRTENLTLYVKPDLYESVAFRKPVRIRIHAGRLGMPWFEVRPRDQTEAP